MLEAVHFNEDNRTGFYIAFSESTGITVKTSGASYEFEITIRARTNFATMGFSPPRMEQFIEALRSRTGGRFDGQTTNDGFIWGDRITLIPKDDGKVQFRATDCGNAPARITLSCDIIDLLVAALDALWVVIPTDTIRLIGHMDDEYDVRFWTDNPGLRAKIDNMILEKRYTLAFNTYHTSHQKWFKDVREPEIMSKPMTEGRLRAIEAALAALRGDS